VQGPAPLAERTPGRADAVPGGAAQADEGGGAAADGAPPRRAGIRGPPGGQPADGAGAGGLHADAANGPAAPRLAVVSREGGSLACGGSTAHAKETPNVPAASPPPRRPPAP